MYIYKFKNRKSELIKEIAAYDKRLICSKKGHLQIETNSPI